MKASKVETHIKFLRILRHAIRTKNLFGLSVAVIIVTDMEFDKCPEYIKNEFFDLLDEAQTILESKQ